MRLLPGSRGAGGLGQAPGGGGVEVSRVVRWSLDGVRNWKTFSTGQQAVIKVTCDNSVTFIGRFSSVLWWWNLLLDSACFQ